MTYKLFFLAILLTIVSPNLICQINSIDISTGLNQTGGVSDSDWRLILHPPTPIPPVGTSAGPAVLINNPPWSSSISTGNGQWIGVNSDGQAPKSAVVNNTYRFARCFCTSGNDTDVKIDMNVLADDRADLWLLKAGNIFEEIPNQTHPLHGNQSSNPGYSSSEHFYLETGVNKGTNCIIIDLHDINTQRLGFAVSGTISGLGFSDLIDNCASFPSMITGYKFEDKNCDGSYSELDDGVLENWTINVIITEPAGIAGIYAFQTNSNGIFTVMDLILSFGEDFSTFMVEEYLPPGWRATRPSDYVLEFDTYHGFRPGHKIVADGLNFLNCPPCVSCITSFTPKPGKSYILNAWVKEKVPPDVLTYDGPEIQIDFPLSGQSFGPFKASGAIIEGWQQIESVFTVPANAVDIELILSNSGSNDVFFDDIRVHPFDANMKSFVYDPVSMKLVAELNEGNFATFYEYDAEGKLVRVKKETEKRIEMIQESRFSSKKH